MFIAALTVTELIYLPLLAPNLPSLKLVLSPWLSFDQWIIFFTLEDTLPIPLRLFIQTQASTFKYCVVCFNSSI